jgi:hypothetical protein
VREEHTVALGKCNHSAAEVAVQSVTTAVYDCMCATVTIEYVHCI